MEEQRHRSWAERFFWPLAIVVVAIVVAAIVVGARAFQDSNDSLKAELNKRYVEKIDITYNDRRNGPSEKVIVIDGDPRYDCSEEDARLSCSDDPKPTLAR